MNHGGYSVFAGVGERTREGNDLYHEMIEGGVIKVDKATGKPIDGSKATLCSLVLVSVLVRVTICTT